MPNVSCDVGCKYTENLDSCGWEVLLWINGCFVLVCMDEGLVSVWINGRMILGCIDPVWMVPGWMIPGWMVPLWMAGWFLDILCRILRALRISFVRPLLLFFNPLVWKPQAWIGHCTILQSLFVQTWHFALGPQMKKSLDGRNLQPLQLIFND